MKSITSILPNKFMSIAKQKALLVITGLLLCLFSNAQTTWDLTGNSGTSPSTNFIGTTDSVPLVFKTKNVEALRLLENGTALFNSNALATGAIFSGANNFGQWVYVNSNSVNASTIAGYRFSVNSAIKSQIFYNGGAFSYGTALDGLAGNTEVLSRNGDVLLSTTTFRTNSLIVKNATGNVGIGNLAPNNKLEITHGTSGNSGLRFTNLTAASTASKSSGKALSLDSNGNVVLDSALNHWTVNGTDIYNNNTGKVGIGTSSPQYLFDVNGAARVTDRLLIGDTLYTIPSQYRLAVKDGIITEKVKVKLKISWPDYVFENSYALQPLSDVADYLKMNKHLPGIPTAVEVKKEGIELGEMNSKLLLKIEELTLYLIKADEEIKALQKLVAGKL